MVPSIETHLAQTDQKTHGISKAHYPIRTNAYIWLSISGNTTNNYGDGGYLTTKAVQRSS